MVHIKYQKWRDIGSWALNNGIYLIVIHVQYLVLSLSSHAMDAIPAYNEINLSSWCESQDKIEGIGVVSLARLLYENVVLRDAISEKIST